MYLMGRPPVSVAVRDQLWALRSSGVATRDAAALVGVSPDSASKWVAAAGGIRPRVVAVSGVRLSLAEREEIACGKAAGLSVRAIAAGLGRSPSTISRELQRNAAVYRGVYRATAAQARAEARARRPKSAKLAVEGPLRQWVSRWLAERYSPEQISGRLVTQFPDRPEMRVSHETIYQSLYVQARGGLKRELVASLRTGRTLRQPQRRPDQRRSRIPNMVSISQRPAEAADRAVPGHWEGDLIIGKDGKSAIGTLVERTTGYCLLLHLPGGRHDAVTVKDAMLAIIPTLPAQLWRSLTWDQGLEMARHAEITTATDLQIYFCDPHSPWQRGSNENTNGLLRQYFPKGTNLSGHTPEHLAAVADQLNRRPRKRHDWQNPAERLHQLLMLQ
jgi:transposase, IS30 family